MKGLKFTVLSFVIGLALLVQLMSTTYAHADGIKTPRPGFTPLGIGTPRITGVPTRIYFTENTTAPGNASTPSASAITSLPATAVPKDSATPDALLHTLLPPRIHSPASTPTNSIASTADSIRTHSVSQTQQISATATPASKVTGTATPGSLNAARITLSPRSTLAATFAVEQEQGKPGQPTITGESGLEPQTPVGTLSPSDGFPLDGPTLPEIHQQIPDSTEILVLNANGELEPLVTQTAADIIAQGDPIWCPDGTKPGEIGCTASYQSMADLLTFAGTYINSQTVNGTIWIASGSQLETGPVTINGSIYTNWANYSLTLQGGWTGTTIGTNSVFNVPIQILNWNANVTINNLTVQNASGSGLGVTTRGSNVAINNSRFLNNRAGSTYFPWGDGADIAPNGGNVTITNSEFTGNNWDGLYIVNSNNISIINSRLNSNGLTNGVGGGLNAYQVNSINIYNSEFTGNLSYDIAAYCNSGAGLIVSYPDVIPPFPTPIRLDIFVDRNCNSSAYLAQPTATPTLTGPTLTATATPTGPLLPTTTPSPTSTPIAIQTETPTPTPTGGFIPTLTPTNPPRRPPTVQPRDPIFGGSSSRPKSKGEFFLDCKLQASFTFPLPNGDKVEIICPSGYWSGKAEISRLDNTTLPDQLPAGFTYASAFLVNITKLREPAQMVAGEFLREEVKVIPDRGYIKASFVALSQETYSILYWDAATNSWIPLKNFMLDEKGKPQVFDLYPEDPDQLMKIISGVRQVANPLDPRVEVSTNFPGIFVLAQH